MISVGTLRVPNRPPRTQAVLTADQETVVVRNVEDPSMEEQDGIYINC